jgi:predicted nucleic acid-binding protein
MNLLIDTNVMLDMVLHRKNCDISLALFRKIRASHQRAYITASSVTDLFYIIRKETHNIEQTYHIMGNILKLVFVLPVTDSDVREAFEQKWKDFEDCVQYTTAKNNHINYIITNNVQDFAGTEIPVLPPSEFLSLGTETE